MRVGLALLATALLATACGAEVPAPVAERAAQWKARGDQAFAAKEWERATDAYHNLYALMDPVPALADQRALVAFRIGRLHAQMAEEAASVLHMINASGYAEIWLREAIALRPTLHQVWYARARLRELDVPDEARNRDLVAAYETYLAGARGSSQPPGPEDARRLKTAEARIRELRAATPEPSRRDAPDPRSGR